MNARIWRRSDNNGRALPYGMILPELRPELRAQHPEEPFDGFTYWEHDDCMLCGGPRAVASGDDHPTCVGPCVPFREWMRKLEEADFIRTLS